jgi:hypothetical protein
MRESRCMSLLPQTTLHSDSEQIDRDFFYNGLAKNGSNKVNCHYHGNINPVKKFVHMYPKDRIFHYPQHQWAVILFNYFIQFYTVLQTRWGSFG